MAELIAQPGTPEWHELRQTGVGASEAAAALGMSPWMTALELYHVKLGTITVEENDAMRIGSALEPEILRMWCRDNGVDMRDVLYPVGLLRHPEIPCVLATPDAWLPGGELWEGKSTTWRAAETMGLGEDGTDDVPAEWLIQCQQQLAVTGESTCHMGVLVDRTLRQFTIERHERLIRNILSGVQAFWQRVIDRDPPEPDFEHASTPQLIREIHSVQEGEPVVLDEATADMWCAYQEHRKNERRERELAEAMRARVLHVIGDAPAGILPGGEKMVRRKVVEKKEYTVRPQAYVDVREVKVKWQGKSDGSA